MTAAVTCRTCGADPRAGARFCDACGAPIESTQPSAEYKQVTVLFADVVRSMDIAAAVGPERLREIMTELLDRSTAVVKRYGGTREPVHGRRHHGGLRRANGAGGSCVSRLPGRTGISGGSRRLASDVMRRDGVDLQLRIGFNSGAGHCGRNRFERFGLHRNRRSGRHGPTHGVGRTARRCDAQRFDRAARRERRGPRRSRTRTHQRAPTLRVAARRLLGHWRAPPSARTESKLVGRTWELNTVTAILEETIRGLGGVVNIVGPGGDRQESDSSAKPRRSRRRATCQCSPLTANHTPATSRSTWSPASSAQRQD